MEAVSFYTVNTVLAFYLRWIFTMLRKYPLNSHFIKNLISQMDSEFHQKPKKGNYRDNQYFSLWFNTEMNWIKRFISIELSFHSWSKLYSENVLLDCISLYITFHQHSHMRLVWSFLFWVLFYLDLFFTVKVCYQSDAGVIKAISVLLSLL